MLREAFSLHMRHQVWLNAAGRFALGGGGSDLLRAVDAIGSIGAAPPEDREANRHILADLPNGECGLGCPSSNGHGAATYTTAPG